MRTVLLPSLHDHHSHTTLYSSLLGLPDISTLSGDAALELLRAQNGDKLGIVKGWRSEILRLDPVMLSKLPPLLIVDFSLHGYALSLAALPYIKDIWPEFFERHDDRAWAERSLPELFSFYCRLADFDEEKLNAFMAGLDALGIYETEDLASPGSDALRVIAESPYADRIISWASPAIYRALGKKEKTHVRGIKLFLDGSIGARSAAIDRDYIGGGRGGLIYSEGELEELLGQAAQYRCALAMHAIGGLAIEEALVVLERCRNNGIAFPFVRLEHVQFIRQGQAMRAKDLGLILSMQPNFNSDSVDYRDRLPVDLLRTNDPFRMLIDQAAFVPGVDLLFGSDGMPHGPEYALQWGLFPPYAGQRISIEEFMAAYSAGQCNVEVSCKKQMAEIDDDAHSVRCLPIQRDSL